MPTCWKYPKGQHPTVVSTLRLMPEDVVRIALVTFYCVYASAIISLLLLFSIYPDINLIDKYNILICAVR